MPPIIHIAAELGQGGTERAIELLATARGAPPGQRVVALDRGGPTAERLLAAGIDVQIFAGDIAAAAAHLGAQVEAVLLLNRAGRPEAKWNALIRRLAGRPVTLLEINHFGWVDRGGVAGGVRGIYCVSGTALAKYLRLWFGGWPGAAQLSALPMAVCAGNNPVAPAPAIEEDKPTLRRRLGLPVAARIAIRLGRPDPRKWSDLLIVHGARLAAAVPDLHLLLLSAPENRAPILRRLLGERAILVPFTTDHGRIAAHLAASDVMLHYARYGESFGYALAEAACAGLPAIAQATPWGDNAQCDVVRHGETGFIAAGFDEARLHLETLLGDPALARRMGEAARVHILEAYGVGATWRLLEAFIAHVRSGGCGLLREPAGLAADQTARLARGMAAYSERFPRLARLAAERPLYAAPWFWRLAASDLAMILRRRLSAQRRLP